MLPGIQVQGGHHDDVVAVDDQAFGREREAVRGRVGRIDEVSCNLVETFVKEGSLSKIKNVDQMILYSGNYGIFMWRGHDLRHL